MFNFRTTLIMALAIVLSLSVINALALSQDEVLKWKKKETFGTVKVPPGIPVVCVGVVSPDPLDKPNKAVVLITPNRKLLSWAYEEDGRIIVMGWNPLTGEYQKQPTLPKHEKSIRKLLKKLQDFV